MDNINFPSSSSLTNFIPGMDSIQSLNFNFNRNYNINTPLPLQLPSSNLNTINPPNEIKLMKKQVEIVSINEQKIEIPKKVLHKKKLEVGSKTKLDYKAEFELFLFFKNLRENGVPCCGDLLKIKAMKIYNTTNEHNFSSQWLAGFKRRWNITRRRICGKSLKSIDVDYEKVKNFIQYVNKIKFSEPDSMIFNFDETGVYYDPNYEYSYDLKGFIKK